MAFRYKVVIVVCLLIMNVRLSPVMGQDDRVFWSAPEFLGDGWFPSLAVDATDTAHIVWHGGNAKALNDLLWYVTRSGQNDEKPATN